MNLHSLLNLLEIEFPPKTSLEGDRIGLQIDSGKTDVNCILFAYELNDLVVEEALKYSSDMIIVFHPLIYFPLKSISDNERVGRLVKKLIKNDISLYVIHTNFDTHPRGTNTIIADKLSLTEREFIQQSQLSQDTHGMGIIGSINGGMELSWLVRRVSELCSSPVRYCYGKEAIVTKVAIVGGSGSSFAYDAYKAGAQAFITADMSYHTFHQYNGSMALIELGHYEMEQFNHIIMSGIVSDLLKDENVKIYKSSVVTNPVNYFPDEEYKKNQKMNIL